MRKFLAIMVIGSFLALGARAQGSQPKANSEHPLPDISSLLRDLKKHQQEVEAIRKDYIFREASTEEELDNDGNAKKTKIEERERFFIGNHSVSRLLKKDGRDLTGDEQQKEQQRIDKEIAKIKKGDSTSDDSGNNLGIDTFLRISKFTNGHREMRNGHETLAFDFAGDPSVKSQGPIEGAVKKLSGRMWIDESKKQIVRLEASFDDNVKVGGGLLASLKKGSNFIFEQALVNDEVWLPTYEEATVGARLLLFKSIHERDVSRFSDYRKFRSKSVIMPGATLVPEKMKDRSR